MSSIENSIRIENDNKILVDRIENHNTDNIANTDHDDIDHTASSTPLYNLILLILNNIYTGGYMYYSMLINNVSKYYRLLVIVMCVLIFSVVSNGSYSSSISDNHSYNKLDNNINAESSMKSDTFSFLSYFKSKHCNTIYTSQNIINTKYVKNKQNNYSNNEIKETDIKRKDDDVEDTEEEDEDEEEVIVTEVPKSKLTIKPTSKSSLTPSVSSSSKYFNRDEFLKLVSSRNRVRLENGNIIEINGAHPEDLYRDYLEYITPFTNDHTEFSKWNDKISGIDKVAIIADSRLENSREMVRISKLFLKLLGPEWSLHVICSLELCNDLKNDKFPSQLIPFIKYLEVPAFNWESYNHLALSGTLLNGIPQEYQVWFQTDSLMLRRSDISEFLNYDYVGAPWRVCPQNILLNSRNHHNPVCYFGGNGGTSFRRRSSMVKLLLTPKRCCTERLRDIGCDPEGQLAMPFECHKRKLNHNFLWEDVFIMYEMMQDGLENYNLSPFEERIDFSVF